MGRELDRTTMLSTRPLWLQRPTMLFTMLHQWFAIPLTTLVTCCCSRGPPCCSPAVWSLQCGACSVEPAVWSSVEPAVWSSV